MDPLMERFEVQARMGTYLAELEDIAWQTAAELREAQTRIAFLVCCVREHHGLEPHAHD